MAVPPNIESLIWDARARIMWGESAAEVAEWLEKQGVDQQRIDELIQTCVKERDRAVRKRGVIEIIIGALAAVAAVGYVFAFWRIGVWTVLLFFAGAFLFINGLFKLFVGGKTHGSLSDM